MISDKGVQQNFEGKEKRAWYIKHIVPFQIQSDSVQRNCSHSLLLEPVRCVSGGKGGEEKGGGTK